MLDPDAPPGKAQPAAAARKVAPDGGHDRVDEAGDCPVCVRRPVETPGQEEEKGPVVGAVAACGREGAAQVVRELFGPPGRKVEVEDRKRPG